MSRVACSAATTTTLLFAGDHETKFVAAALRPLLNAVTLTPDQWVDIAVGGALLANNAVRDMGISHVAGFSPARLERLEKATRPASSGERDAFDSILQKLRAMRPSDAPAPDGGTGSWFSRAFKKPPPKA